MAKKKSNREIGGDHNTQKSRAAAVISKKCERCGNIFDSYDDYMKHICDST